MIEIEMRMNSDDFGISLAGTAKKASELFERKKVPELDAGSFQVLLDPLKNHLYNFIFKSLNFSEDASDVYQDTVMRAFKYRSGFRTDENFKTWIFTIAHNQVKHYFNRFKKKVLHSDPQLLQNLSDDSHDSEQQLVRDIYRLAGKLKPDWRRVFFLFYDQQFSISDISEITGLKEGNIKFILNRCRELIKQMIHSGCGQKKGEKNESSG